MTPPVALIVGGSIGAEVLPPVLEVLTAAGAEFEWRRVDVATPSDEVERQAELLDQQLEAAVAAVKTCGVGLKTRLIGPPAGSLVPDTDSPGPMNSNVLLRQRLGLFAGVRPIKSLPGLPTRYPDLDLLIIRENTEDIYKGIEHEIVPGVVQSLKVVTREACERIARYAFRIAREHGRERVTFVHKANILKQTDGLFLRTVRGIAAEHPEIAYREMIVDAACMQLVLDPYQFDLVLTGNLYGDILSNLCAGLAGGISLAYGIDIGRECRIFDALHGDAPHLVGTGKANPLPLLAAAQAMLRHFEMDAVAERIGGAIAEVLAQRARLTPDLGGEATTREMCEAIRARLS